MPLGPFVMATWFASTGMSAPWRFWVPNAEDIGPEIIHHDRQLLIVHKPPGLPTTAPTSTEPCLAHWVRDRFPDLQAHATSRLDSQVSGLVTFALTSDANRHLLDARRAGAYDRVYLGITVREVSPDQGEWSWPISIDPRNPKRRVAGPGRGEREALTRYEVVARTPAATLLRLRPQTGRTHQLRVHAAKANAPLFGDHLYQGERRKVLPEGSVVTVRRVMLHCARVSFPPLSPGVLAEERMRLEAPVPPDLVQVWQALGGARSDFQL
jgi:23S rRNA-/tRNA-specific pseudouridylate synthase